MPSPSWQPPRQRACHDGLVIVPAVPVPLRVFCDLLRRDQGRMLGSAVLFASVVGLDVVEQRKGDIAAISGVPVNRIQEIVDTGRRALSSASPKRPMQHVVSQVILRQFLGPTSQGDRLLAYNLRYGKAKLRAPKAVGSSGTSFRSTARRPSNCGAAPSRNCPPRSTRPRHAGFSGTRSMSP